MHDQDIKVALPTRLAREPEYCPAVVLKHYTLLSKILGQIMAQIYRHTPRPGSVLMGAVQGIMSALAQWEREIPHQLRFDPVRMTASRESVSTFLHYYHCINMTARPLLFHVVEKRLKGPPAERNKDWKEGLSQATISVIETCVFAARDAISMLKAAAENDMIAVFGYMDGEHAVSATLVLVMVCVAFPFDLDNALAMDTALSILETMASKGNHHIAARRRMLLQLSSGLDRPAPRPIEVDLPAMNGAHTSQASLLPVLDDLAWAKTFNGDHTMFEAAYLDTELSLEFDWDQWTQEVGQPTDSEEDFNLPIPTGCPCVTDPVPF